jgi:site-specific recombinase XerD
VVIYGTFVTPNETPVTPTFLIKAVLPSKAPDKNGELPIMIRITANRKKYFKVTGYKVNPDFFSESELISNKVSNYQLKNGKVTDQLRKIEKALLQHEVLTPEIIKQTLSPGKQKEEKTAGITLEKLCTLVRREYANSLSDLTLNGFTTCVNKVIAYNKADLPISAITPHFLTKYEGYLNKELKQAPTTTWSDLKELRSLFNKGIKIKAITEYPFSEYSVPKYVQPKRNYLTSDQVATIEAYADDESKPAPLRKVAAWFVFSCYSGLRYSDLAAFDNTWIKNEKLYFSDYKEQTPHFVPLYPKLRTAIDRVRQFMPIMENQPFNRFLKEIMVLCRIDVTLTVHIARHTFAVTYLDNGGSKEVLQRLMGHKKMSTTEIYGQISDKRIEDEAKNVFGS